MNRKVHIIINPNSGMASPILWDINQAFKKTPVEWDVSITKKTEAARGLTGYDVPLAIIPGGTANVVAKDLNIPVNTLDALSLLTGSRLHTKEIDIAYSGKQPVILGYVAGMWADVVHQAKRSLKEQYGRLAYGITALQQLSQTQQSVYSLSFDDKPPVKIEGAAMVIANTGNIGLPGISLVPGVSMSDGWLDAILIRTIDVATVLSWLNSTITQTKPKGKLLHWRFKSLHMNIRPKQTVICDDRHVDLSTIHIRVAPKTLRVVVPHGKTV